MKPLKLTKNKKAQAWSLDLIVAGAIFMIGIIVLYVYTVNYSSQTKSDLNELFYEGNLASQLILSEEDDGILSEQKINQTKLEEFDSLSSQEKKSILGLNNDFYFTFPGLEIGGTPVDYIGIMNTTDTESLIQVTRLTIYKNKPVKFLVYSWK